MDIFFKFRFPWNKLKPLLLHKLNLKIDEYHEKCPMDSQTVCPNVEAVSYDDMRKRLTDSLNQFTGYLFFIFYRFFYRQTTIDICSN